ncbi:DUF1294 domain-containing protein [Oceanobacillus sp. 143]|jgi:uncharacterized membrane protein YsdA (DUF1294 family)|uniref:DUF1294 domain-containing protein n=1 Tax=Oceanobacillus zhaokaii TaxID=2052660 RepID=A0A345PI21_9BACI|nr:DUF1294 domain-containing protein [Oceanobacillus zhaokaii]AXI09651.1 DUF1294 domain-containing protein [Oceanobacillus zhaokaii]QGS68996.1 DUF1294 domain-containing protein [Oceanobacillus sp. 143]
MEMENQLLAYILLVNVIEFFLMRVDKQKAIKGQYRIPERTFWLLALLGGAIGGYAGMKVFRHKTKHRSFTIGMPILIIINIALFGYFITALG